MRTDLEAAQDLVSSINHYFWAEEFKQHREDAYLEERAKIVAWLREQQGVGNSDENTAFCIEAGEHLK